MSLENSSLHQKAVLWVFDSYDSNGEPKVSEPVEIPCRWEEVSSQLMDNTSSLIAINSEIWVNQVLVKGSMLWKGELVNLPAPADAIVEVVGFDVIPDIKGRNFELVAYARRYKESLPTVV
jgi:hypothetical protein